MSGFPLGNIPGHSGTQFKYRKAFERRKELLHKRYQKGTLGGGEIRYQSTEEVNRYRRVIIPIFIFTTIALLAFAWQVREDARHTPAVKYPKELVGRQQLGYLNLVAYGERYLSAGGVCKSTK